MRCSLQVLVGWSPACFSIDPKQERPLDVIMGFCVSSKVIYCLRIMPLGCHWLSFSEITACGIIQSAGPYFGHGEGIPCLIKYFINHFQKQKNTGMQPTCWKSQIYLVTYKARNTFSSIRKRLEFINVFTSVDLEGLQKSKCFSVPSKHHLQMLDFYKLCIFLWPWESK